MSGKAIEVIAHWNVWQERGLHVPQKKAGAVGSHIQGSMESPVSDP